MTGSPSRSEIERLLEDAEQQEPAAGAEIIIRDTVVETPWSSEAGRDVPPDEVTRLTWTGTEWAEVEL